MVVLKQQLDLIFLYILCLILVYSIFKRLFQVLLDLHLRCRNLFLIHSATEIPALHPQHLQMMILDLIGHLIDCADDLLLHLELWRVGFRVQLEPFNVLVYLFEALISLRLQDFLVHLLPLQVSGLEVVQELVVLADTRRDRGGDQGVIVIIDVLGWTAHIN